mmetsp:Transcript_23125/g.52379  ORF Transcript_23125/g.52379 Transcript_23125/m.52379 type:complete len:644 (-) Transcript_23125:80-2011(-)
MILRRKDDDLSAVGDGFCVDDNKDGDLLEYDPEPVFRRMGTLNCKDSCCPNFGGRCPLHGKERLTCRVKGCDRFDQKRGLCVKHLGADKGVTRVPVKSKKKFPATRGRGQSRSKGEAAEGLANEKQASAVVAPDMDKDVVISMYNNAYKALMHKRFREVEDDPSISVNEMAIRIVKDFQEHLTTTGGVLQKRSRTGELSEIDSETATKKVCQDIYDRNDTYTAWKKKLPRHQLISGYVPKSNNPKPLEAVSSSFAAGVNITGDVFITMRDEDHPQYKLTMNQLFNTLPNNPGQRANVKKAAANVFNFFKSELAKTGGSFKRRTKAEGSDGFESLDDDVVLARIKRDIKNRNQPCMLKMRGGVARTVTPNKKRRRSAKTDDELEEDDSRYTRRAKRTAFCKDQPLKYVGNHLGVLLRAEGWATAWRKTDGINFDQIYFDPRCKDRKMAVEGVDMLSGHEAVALWAYKTGYYERNVVQTEGGRRLLHRAGILEDPYSIFGGRESGDAKPAANSTYGEDNETDSQLAVDTTDETTDEGLSFYSNSMQKTRALFKKVQAEYELAHEQEDEQGSIFYSHLLLYLEKKAHLKEFNLGKELEIIAKNVSEYEETKRDHLDAEKRGLPGKGFYKSCLSLLITQCKEKLPLT